MKWRPIASRVARGALGNERVERLVRAAQGLGDDQTSIPELVSVVPRPSRVEEPRLNLVIPAIRQDQVFGGVATALAFFAELGAAYDKLRLIVMDRLPPSERMPAAEGYTPVALGEDVDLPAQVVSLAQARGKTLPVGLGDRFIATAWPTALAAQGWLSWMGQAFPAPAPPLVYLIQDYEPGFYPWSSRFLLARSSYEYDGPMIAVFNTALLRDHVHAQGHRFDHSFSFEPRMHPGLRALLPHRPDAKHRQILLYGRPSVPRNAFALLVESLRVWAARSGRVQPWTVLSAGENHEDVLLGGGMTLRSVGKLSIQEYARLLRESAVGLSWMVSPHPSYPPLEMAHYGIRVITNQFGTKDLAEWHDNITSVSRSSPEQIADAIAAVCREVDADRMAGWNGRSKLSSFLSDEPPFPFVQRIRCLLGTIEE